MASADSRRINGPPFDASQSGEFTPLVQLWWKEVGGEHLLRRNVHLIVENFKIPTPDNLPSASLLETADQFLRTLRCRVAFTEKHREEGKRVTYFGSGEFTSDSNDGALPFHLFEIPPGNSQYIKAIFQAGGFVYSDSHLKEIQVPAFHTLIPTSNWSMFEWTASIWNHQANRDRTLLVVTFPSDTKWMAYYVKIFRFDHPEKVKNRFLYKKTFEADSQLFAFFFKGSQLPFSHDDIPQSLAHIRHSPSSGSLAKWSRTLSGVNSEGQLEPKEREERRVQVFGGSEM